MFDRWMRVKITNEMLKPFRVFRISSENRTFINKKFDVLHQQNKIKWTTRFISYVFSIFVIWITVHAQKKKPRRKNRVIMNIRNPNKISKFDAYFMSFQSDIISCLQKCKFISIMNCALFFHQWRVIIKNRHKLTMMTHREIEQWNVAVMDWKKSSVYVQREIDEIFKKYSYAKIYIDDVIVFSNFLKKHLNYLNTVFKLFQNWNITLKAMKIYFDYFSVFLLNQKIDSFELVMTKKKLKAISQLNFFKYLKNLKIYFEVIEYFRNYISYYAQKSKIFNQKKTKLLKNNFIKNAARKNFSKKILLKQANEKKLKSYRQFQNDFSKFNWFIHFDIEREFYTDIDASENDFDIIVYHVKKKRKNQFFIKKKLNLFCFFQKHWQKSKKNTDQLNLKWRHLSEQFVE